MKNITNTISHLKRRYSLLVLMIFLSSISLSGQYFDKAPQYTIGGRINAPIKVEVNMNDNGFLFTAMNKSLFPYEFELTFSELSNLSPMISTHKTILEPGSNRLFALKILDKQSSPNYQYSYTYRIGSRKQKVEKGFQYLIPLADGKKVEYVTEETDNKKTVLISYFNIKRGDTIFAARRGYVTAIPDPKIELDRIKEESSLEIRHYDGTVAVYSGIDPSQVIAKIGRAVYPGQPLGLTTNNVFHLSVYEFLGEGRIRSFKFLYANQSPDQMKTAQDIRGETVLHPIEIITREMTKRELKKYKKGILFK